MLYRNLADEIGIRALQLREKAFKLQRDERKAAEVSSSDTTTSEDDAGSEPMQPQHHQPQRHEHPHQQKQYQRKQHLRPRIPRETDARALLQTLATQDDLIRQMELALFSPEYLDELVKLQTVGLSRRAAALVATARRREAVLELQLRALTTEVDAFRAREKEAEDINESLHEQLGDAHADLNDALADLDGMRREQEDAKASMHRQVHRTREANSAHEMTLQAELRAAAQREMALRHELHLQQHAAATAATAAAEAIRSRDVVIQRYAAADAARAEEERRMAGLRDDMRYVSDLAEHAISR